MKRSTWSEILALRPTGQLHLGALLLPLLTALTAGCGLDFDPPSKLDSLRILGVQLDPPEARAGEAVLAQALVFLPASAGAAAQLIDGQQQGGAGLPDGLQLQWRACLLPTSSSALGGGGLEQGGPLATERLPGSCFDLPEVVEQAQLPAAADPAGCLAQGTAAGEGLDRLPAVALGEGPTVELGAALTRLLLPPASCPAGPSICPRPTEAEALEQGGRERWITGLRLTLSLRASAGGETVVANKRLLLRPALDELSPPAADGVLFASPRLCLPGVAGADARWCARNVNPGPPELTAPNGEWSGQGELVVAPGQQVKLRPLLPAEDQQQSFVAMLACGQQQQTEELRRAGGEYVRQEGSLFSWYADCGELVTAATTFGLEAGQEDSAWEAPEADALPPDGRCRLLLVVRDGRGGMAWRRIEARVSGN